MKLQLDTRTKIITIEEDVNLKELYNLLNKILPNGEWEEYSLNRGNLVFQTQPIIIQPYVQEPFYPWWGVQPPPSLVPGQWITTSDYTYNIQTQS
jgi:hypothetical protein